MSGWNLPDDVSECPRCGVLVASWYPILCDVCEPLRDEKGRFIAKPKTAGSLSADTELDRRGLDADAVMEEVMGR